MSLLDWLKHSSALCDVAGHFCTSPMPLPWSVGWHSRPGVSSITALLSSMNSKKLKHFCRQWHHCDIIGVASQTRLLCSGFFFMFLLFYLCLWTVEHFLVGHGRHQAEAVALGGLDVHGGGRSGESKPPPADGGAQGAAGQRRWRWRRGGGKSEVRYLPQCDGWLRLGLPFTVFPCCFLDLQQKRLFIKILSTPFRSESPCFVLLCNLLTQIPRLWGFGFSLSPPGGRSCSSSTPPPSAWRCVRQVFFSLSPEKFPQAWVRRKSLLPLSRFLLLLLLHRHLNEPLPAMTHYPQCPPSPHVAAPIHLLQRCPPISSQRGRGALLFLPLLPLWLTDCLTDRAGNQPRGWWALRVGGVVSAVCMCMWAQRGWAPSEEEIVENNGTSAEQRLNPLADMFKRGPGE